MKHWLIILGIGMLFGASLCHFIERKTSRSDEVITKCDTIIVRDTITRENPREIRILQRDTILVAVTDTIRAHDTLYIRQERQVKEYRDSSYYARVSGIEPRLDYLELYKGETKIMTQFVKKPSKWSIGLQVGVGVNSKVEINPYIGIGVSYNLLNLHR